MKIGFIGNMNNYPFPVALAMRKQGIDVRFVVDSLGPLHRPEFRYDENELSYGSWLFDLAPLRMRDLAFPTPKQWRLRALLRNCDAIVANGMGIAFSTFFEKPSFLIVAGSDLDVMANEDHLAEIESRPAESLARLTEKRLLIPFYRHRLKRQQAAFLTACGVDYPLPGMLPHGDKLLTQIGVRPDRRFALMPTDLDHCPETPLPRNHALRILASARLCWREPLPHGFGVLDNKRNDVLVHGVAAFRQRNATPLELRLPKKGLHLADTQQLVERLGLGDVVVWLDEMTQAAFTEEMIAADIVADHFGEGSIGMAVREAMALGRPVIAHGKSEIFERNLGEPLPIADARTPEQVAQAIEILSDRQERERRAAAGRAFAERYFSAERAARTIVSVFGGK